MSKNNIGVAYTVKPYMFRYDRELQKKKRANKNIARVSTAITAGAGILAGLSIAKKGQNSLLVKGVNRIADLGMGLLKNLSNKVVAKVKPGKLSRFSAGISNTLDKGLNANPVKKAVGVLLAYGAFVLSNIKAQKAYENGKIDQLQNEKILAQYKSIKK